jgi:hypothetical protein
MAADAADSHRFDIALSFPGEHRDYVKEVAAHLASTFGEDRVLYDHFHDAEFARLDLNTYLPALYRKDSELIVIFLCPEYAAKLWCRLEWRHISQLIAGVDAQRIMFLSFGHPGDLSDLGILGGDGYINVLPLTPQVAAEKILKRLSLNKGTTAPLTRPDPLPALAPAPAPASLVRADIYRIDKYAPAELIGREAETQLLSDAWAKAVSGATDRPRVLTFVALGGEGKTSLVAKWAANLAHHNWNGCDALFAWSFYSQGTRDQTAASSDLFLADALTFFGDPDIAKSNQSAFDKGRRLAQMVGERRALLILDGVEPLQYASTSPTPGELKDAGLSALLKGLAANNRGLCVLTTRYSIPDLNAYRHTTAPEIKLLRLSKDAGVSLLKLLGVKGVQSEYETLVEDVKGHALTLNLLGSYLVEAHVGDIRKRDLVKLEDADEEQGGHAFRVMDAYVHWFATGGRNAEANRKGQRAITLLQLLGLFDRPATANCLNALLKAPVIPDLTEPFASLTEAQRNISFARLEAAKLITINRDDAGTLRSLDAHPLLREYFAKQLRTKHPEACRAAHRRVFEHLCATTKEGDQPTLEGLQPLYQAVAHGCQAGMQQETCDKVYHARIQRGQEAYSTHKLGALGADLGAVACFFQPPWSRLSPTLTQADQGWLLNEAAFRLRALGRLSEALEPMRISGEMAVTRKQWRSAAISFSNLSGLKMTLGEVAGALGDALVSMAHADRSTDVDWQIRSRATHADALNQAGFTDSQALFCEAERLQAEYQPDHPLLYSMQGFEYCYMLLAAPERATWRFLLRNQGIQWPNSDIMLEEADIAATQENVPRHKNAKTNSKHDMYRNGQGINAPQIESCRAVSLRAMQTLKWAEENNLSLLSIALDHLTLARAALYEAILAGESLSLCQVYVRCALDWLRRAGQQDDLPRGLLTRALLRGISSALTIANAGTESAQSDLDEAWEIAERGPMPLFLADIHLHRARLFGPHASGATGEPYPWESPAIDLAAARALIMKHGYLRRLEELEDAEAAAKTW